jgi:hypothetical protein
VLVRVLVLVLVLDVVGMQELHMTLQESVAKSLKLSTIDVQ